MINNWYLWALYACVILISNASSDTFEAKIVQSFKQQPATLQSSLKFWFLYCSKFANRKIFKKIKRLVQIVAIHWTIDYWKSSYFSPMKYFGFINMNPTLIHSQFLNISGSSVCSNTPSLVGENLESFTLGESEKTSGTNATPGGAPKNPWAVNTTPLVQISAPPLRRSLFSHVPPTINFVHHNEVSVVSLPAELRKLLRWKLSNITPAVVKKVVTNSGFRLMRKTCSEWGGTWGKHMKAEMFKELHECQKINHLPGKPSTLFTINIYLIL